MNKFTKRIIPYSAQIELTLKCMGKCRFCSIPSIPDSLKNNEMKTEEVKRIIDEIHNLKIVALSFTGGEPTLRKDLPELIKYSGEEKGLITGLATNGYLIPQIYKRNGLTGLDYILLSLDYPIDYMHNKMRGVDVFDNAIRTIKLAHKNNVNVIISTNVMKSNMIYLSQICKLAEDLGCSIELYPCEDIVRFYEGVAYRRKHVKELIPNLDKWAKMIRSLRKRYSNILTDHISTQIVQEGGFGGRPKHQEFLRCHVAGAYLFIRHDGKISFPCKIHPLLSFNALKYPLWSLYNMKEVRDIINEHDQYDFCNGCYLGCAITSSMTAQWNTVYEKYIKGLRNLR
ncbi:MAG: radical SAM protein [Candidatus Lokiarchaeota archaeon]|nr:radical SAM protein [Candidatus Lokiarchaeota archaeon]MBD3199379.1 radical SAM protein [Candidatus Lokiarchaeota archaeon]